MYSSTLIYIDLQIWKYVTDQIKSTKNECNKWIKLTEVISDICSDWTVHMQLTVWFLLKLEINMNPNGIKIITYKPVFLTVLHTSCFERKKICLGFEQMVEFIFEVQFQIWLKKKKHCAKIKKCDASLTWGRELFSRINLLILLQNNYPSVVLVYLSVIKTHFNLYIELLNSCGLVYGAVAARVLLAWFMKII